MKHETKIVTLECDACGVTGQPGHSPFKTRGAKLTLDSWVRDYRGNKAGSVVTYQHLCEDCTLRVTRLLSGADVELEDGDAVDRIFALERLTDLRRTVSGPPVFEVPESGFIECLNTGRYLVDQSTFDFLTSRGIMEPGQLEVYQPNTRTMHRDEVELDGDLVKGKE